MNCFKLSLMLFLMFVSQNYAQDWANLERFQKENALLIDPDPTEDRIVFMGNSITEGWKNNEDIVRVAEFHILEDMHIMSIDMDRADWLESLTLALDFYEEIEDYEKCIDVKGLIEEMS